MILLICSLAGVILGLLTGGSFAGLSRYPLKGLLLPVAAFAVKSGAAWLLTPQTGALAVCLTQYALLFLFFLLNYRRPVWPIVAFTGSLMNLLVISLNGGCMPVSTGLLGGASERLVQLSQNRIYAYTLMNETTRLPFLGDVIRLGPAGVPAGFASIGDILLCAGVALLLYQMTKAKAPETAEKPAS